MIGSVTLAAPAKVNLHLDIGARRSDGFHNLRSLFVMIGLYDELSAAATAVRGCSIQGCGNIPLEQNLIWKAYNLYCEAADEFIGLSVNCRKRIPAMAGLGGGSSDAAAMLRILQMIHPVVLPQERLTEIAAQLGSDVPFFLVSPSALVAGRGEIIEPIATPERYSCVVVKPEFDISTGLAYRKLDAFEGVKDKSLSLQEIHHYYQQPPKRWEFFNSFTGVLTEEYPQITALLQMLKDRGAEYANVSGSGSALFGVFRDTKAAESCYLLLKKDIKKVWKVKMLASLTEAVYN
ncbi:MAG: 4-(cytidine 5'-diphospho)-2-C-methyl-D-erythritol kinase [Spirochaetia bacterium]